MCVANCRFEDTNQELLTLPDDIKAKDCWEILHGGHFIPLWRSGGLGWTQAYLLDTRIAHMLGAFEEPYMLNKPLANKLALADDTLWGFVFVMAAIGSVALTGKVVCVAGRPEGSYSRSSPKWLQTRTKAKFIILYNIYRSNLKGPSAQIAKDTAKRQALDQARQANLFDLKILRHYKFSPEIIYYSSAYLLKKLRRSIKNFNKRAKQRLKGIVNR